MNRILMVLAFLLLWSQGSQAEIYQQIQGAFRSFPQSGSIEAHSYYNQKLWEATADGAPWKYGFWKAGGFVAVHGQAAIKLDVYPISFWQISYQESLTARFYETRTLNCLEVHCGGSLRRGTVKTNLALAYGSFFLVPGFSYTHLTLDSDKKNFSSEEDNLIADRLGDYLSTSQVVLGYKMDKQRVVFVSKRSSMKVTKDSNFSQLLVWNRDYNSEINYFVGAGFFESSHVNRGLTMVAGLNWTVGENLSLF